MAKYSTEFKIKIVKDYLEYKSSSKFLSEKYCIPDKSMVIRWV